MLHTLGYPKDSNYGCRTSKTKLFLMHFSHQNSRFVPTLSRGCFGKQHFNNKAAANAISINLLTFSIRWFAVVRLLKCQPPTKRAINVSSWEMGCKRISLLQSRFGNATLSFLFGISFRKVTSFKLARDRIWTLWQWFVDTGNDVGTWGWTAQTEWDQVGSNRNTFTGQVASSNIVLERGRERERESII